MINAPYSGGGGLVPFSVDPLIHESAVNIQASLPKGTKASKPKT